jgi:hypothetical protein
MEPMTTGIATLRVEELVARIGSDAVSPGAGAAGAVALALAAACACKAVSVTLKHRPDDPELQAAIASLTTIARTALNDADRDAAAFREFALHKDPAAVQRLVGEGENVAQLVAALATAMDAIETRIRPNMAGDLIAAKALMSAAHCIQERNETEALSGS